MNLELILKERAAFINERDSKFPNTHILLSLLQQNDYAIDKTEKVVMYMMYACTREGLSFSSNKKDFLFNDCMNRYENLEGKLINLKGRLIMKSIELPLRAYNLYVKREYDVARKMLLNSLSIYNEIFDSLNGEVIWANLEQNLNLLRIYIDNGEVKYVIHNVPQIIDEFYLGIANGLNNLSTEMAYYIRNGNFTDETKYHFINYLVDALLRKLTRNKAENNKDIMISLLHSITESVAYSHLKPFIQESLNEDDFNKYYSFDTNIPKVMDLFILNKSSYYLGNKNLIDDFLLNVYNFKTES